MIENEDHCYRCAPPIYPCFGGGYSDCEDEEICCDECKKSIDMGISLLSISGVFGKGNEKLCHKCFCRIYGYDEHDDIEEVLDYKIDMEDY